MSGSIIQNMPRYSHSVIFLSPTNIFTHIWCTGMGQLMTRDQYRMVPNF